jgi:hypothetical protein
MPFQELLLATCFSACEQVLYCSAFAHLCRCLPVLKRRTKPNEAAKKLDETANKNQEPKM